MDKVKNPIGWGFLSWLEGVSIFLTMGGGLPPPHLFPLRHLLIFKETFFIIHAVKKVNWSAPKEKIFINDVLKVQNQAIRMFLHSVIMKILARDKKVRGGVGAPPPGPPVIRGIY